MVFLCAFRRSSLLIVYFLCGLTSKVHPFFFVHAQVLLTNVEQHEVWLSLTAECSDTYFLSLFNANRNNLAKVIRTAESTLLIALTAGL